MIEASERAAGAARVGGPLVDGVGNHILLIKLVEWIDQIHRWISRIIGEHRHRQQDHAYQQGQRKDIASCISFFEHERSFDLGQQSNDLGLPRLAAHPVVGARPCPWSSS